MGRMSQTTSRSPSSLRHVSCLPWASRYDLLSVDNRDVCICHDKMSNCFVLQALSLCLQFGLEMSYWTTVNAIFVLGSLAMYFAVTFAMYSDGLFRTLPSAFSFVGEWYKLWRLVSTSHRSQHMSLILFRDRTRSWLNTNIVDVCSGSARNSLNQPSFWLTIFLTSILCVLPVITYRFLLIQLCPSINDKVRLEILKSAGSPTYNYAYKSFTWRLIGLIFCVWFSKEMAKIFSSHHH